MRQTSSVIKPEKALGRKPTKILVNHRHRRPARVGWRWLKNPGEDSCRRGREPSRYFPESRRSFPKTCRYFPSGSRSFAKSNRSWTEMNRSNAESNRYFPSWSRSNAKSSRYFPESNRYFPACNRRFYPGFRQKRVIFAKNRCFAVRERLFGVFEVSAGNFWEWLWNTPSAGSAMSKISGKFILKMGGNNFTLAPPM